ncbi:MAG TPA: sugar phosphate nucleotidyltransferase [Candidatus Saccharimonadales bacterium]|nr:sugar phosphate nucleotidyltransferase [Candidatus Saccharimonadales bacterium]
MTKVLIVAGGKGERLRPITDTIAKPMVKVGDKPVLEHNLDLFKKAGFSDFIFALCYLPQTISDYFKDDKDFGVNIEYTYENPEVPLGTAGAVTLAKDKIDSTFIVTYGDSLRVVDVKKMWDFHKEKKAFATICIYKRFGADPKSMIKTAEDGEILEFKERPTPEELTEDFVWANAALYIFEPEIYHYIKEGEMVDFGKDVFPKLLEEKKKVFAFPMEGYFIDIGNKEKLDQANADFKDGLLTT